jgi:hypothetical protein
MYEHRRHKMLSRSAFSKRVLWHLLLASGLAGIALAIGIVGYRYLGELEWLDALLNASMILGGMGPVDPLRTTSGKLFASFYALFSGLVFIGVASVIVAPFVHRLLHHFHMDERG